MKMCKWYFVFFQKRLVAEGVFGAERKKGMGSWIKKAGMDGAESCIMHKICGFLTVLE